MAPDKDDLFGELAVKRGLITQEELDQARENQRTMLADMGVELPLAQLLVSKGLLSEREAQELNHEVEIETGEARLVAGYEIVWKLSEGSYGAVYKARQLDTGNLVALKILLPSRADQEHITRFRREAEIIRTLNHENIVGLVEFGHDDRRNLHFCALELVEGEDLHRIIKRRGRLAEDEAISITEQIALALQHADYHKLVHRDVKPANIMVTPDGTAKLCDLGLACPVDKEATRVTRTGAIVGSWHYISPEQASRKRDVDIRSDVYSLGATLYHMVTGRPPFEGDAPLAVLQKQISERAPWPADLNPDVSDWLCLVIVKMMAKKPAERYQKPEDLHRDLLLLERNLEPVIEEGARRTSSIAPAAVLRPRRAGPPPPPRRRKERLRCRTCGMSIPASRPAEGHHICPVCGTAIRIPPEVRVEERAGRWAIEVTGSCGYEDLLEALEPTVESVLLSVPVETVLDVSGLKNVPAELAGDMLSWTEKLRAGGGRLKVLCGGKALERFTQLGVTSFIDIQDAAKAGPEGRFGMYEPADIELHGDVIKFHCRCGKRISVPLDAAKAVGHCPKCRIPVFIAKPPRAEPRPGAAPPP